MIDRSSTSTVNLLVAATTTGTSDVVPTGMFKTHAVQVVKVGTAGAFSLTVEGSLDGTNWETIGAALTTSGAIKQFTGLYEYLRANLGTLAGGDTVTVTYKWG